MTFLSQRAWVAAQDVSPIEVSFEFFPPASEPAFNRLIKTAEHLEPYAPRFLSVTCGAGGTDDLGADKSFQAIQILRQQAQRLIHSQLLNLLLEHLLRERQQRHQLLPHHQ